MSEHIQAVETLFRNALDALPGLDDVKVFTDFSSAEKDMPCVTVKAVLNPLAKDFSAFTYLLTVTIESTADGETAVAAHSAIVATISTALHTTGKAALMAAINGVGTYDMRGWTPEKPEPELENSHFKTPVGIGGTALKI